MIPRGRSRFQKERLSLNQTCRAAPSPLTERQIPAWRTPHMFDLPQGVYRISVSQEGYTTWYRVVRVTPGHKHWLTADLHMPRGVIVIDTEPPGMQVFIDGKAYGPSEVEASLDAGSHEFKVVPPGGKRPLEGSFVLKPGDVVTRKDTVVFAGRPADRNQQD